MTSVSLSMAAGLLSSDSFVAGLILGPFLQDWRKRTLLAFLFAACDGAATLIGAVWSLAAPAPHAIVLYLVAVPAIAVAAVRSRRWLFVLPALLGLDNLIAGLPAETAPVLALASGLAALSGLTAGRCLGRGAEIGVAALGRA